MVSFRAFLVSALALTMPMAAQVTPAQLVQSNLKTLIQKGQSLQGQLQGINFLNGPLVLIGQGPFPAIIRGFGDTISTTKYAIQLFDGANAVPAGAQSDVVFSTFRDVCPPPSLPT
jgi:hypothetical protein